MFAVASAKAEAKSGGFHWVVTIGSSSIGILVGILLGFYVQEADKWDRKALAAAASLIGGGGAMGLVHFLTGTSGAQRETWFYPIGLLVGFIIGTIWEYLGPPN